MIIVGISGNLGSGKDTVADMLVAQHGMLIVAFADELKRLCKVVFDYTDEQLWGPSKLRNSPDPRWMYPDYAKTVLGRFHDQRDRIEKLFRDAPSPPSWVEILANFQERMAAWEALGAQASCRKVLQHMGTEWGRKLWDRTWLHAVKKTVGFIHHYGQGYTRSRGLVPTLTIKDWTIPTGFVIPDTRFPNEATFNHEEMKAKNVWVDASVRAPVPPELAHASEPKRADFRVTMPGSDEVVDLIDHDIDNNGPLDALPGHVQTMLNWCFPLAHRP